MFLMKSHVSNFIISMLWRYMARGRYSIVCNIPDFVDDVPMGKLTVVKPVPETIESVLHEVLGCSEIEPWINCLSINYPRAASAFGNPSSRIDGLVLTFMYDALESW